jgi:hypothetical protein
MSARFAALWILCVLSSGCALQSPEELERLVKEDPTFKQMIGARDQAHVQMALIKQDLLTRKKAMDVQVEKLRAEHAAVAATYNKKIEQLRASIESHRQILKRDIESASAQVEAKSTELAGYQKTLADVRKVLHESKGITLSKAERQKWEERVLMLSEKMRPLTDEINELKLQIRLKKQKVQYLR